MNNKQHIEAILSIIKTLELKTGKNYSGKIDIQKLLELLELDRNIPIEIYVLLAKIAACVYNNKVIDNK